MQARTAGSPGPRNLHAAVAPLLPASSLLPASPGRSASIISVDHAPHPGPYRRRSLTDRPPGPRLLLVFLNGFEDRLVLVEGDAELLDHRLRGCRVGREVFHEQPVVDAAVGIDRRDEVTRERSWMQLSRAPSGAPVPVCCAAEVDHRRAWRGVVIIVPPVDIAAEVAEFLEQRDRRRIDDPAPGDQLVRALLSRCGSPRLRRRRCRASRGARS